jgi:arylsulfatase A
MENDCRYRFICLMKKDIVNRIRKIFILLMILILSNGIGYAQQNLRPPNIVLIVADDLGIGDLGCYGQKLIKTPHLDRLAKNGKRFTQFYAGTSVCAPSRASLMTGLHTGHTAIRGNREIQPEGQWPLPAASVTIAAILKRNGYTTGSFGKWGLGPVGSAGDPLNQGFDFFFGYNCQRQSHNYYPPHLWKQQQKLLYPSNTVKSQTDYAPAIIQQEALGFIKQHTTKPFFLYLSYTLPHAALQTPDDSLFNIYKQMIKEQPAPINKWNGTGYQPQAYPKAAYATMVARLDQYVGQVMETLREQGIDQNTLVIFTSDNGPHKEGGNDPDYFNSNGQFRGYKRDLYEGGIRVPMIVSWPGKTKAGSISRHVAAFWDFLPTLAEIAGDSSDIYTDGISFVPELRQRRQQPHEFLYWEFHEGGGRQAVRMDQWKAVRLNIIENEYAPIALYDLRNDPGETKDLSRRFPNIVARMRAVMQHQHIEQEEFPLLKQVP